ncbi:IS701 family transposase [Amycolatopsis jiangsuensis]|uniref:SRSO17 transposase n=1 Tax=Amycolatopsis jiangsuensis TaxID=1181879 RepID=A0A840J6E4_9PSEU|nr:IS701 family transposase [Amycolatopsis jiangsuensis]MBB4689600.1 SRSO17 transposase [Amycolatopsis jiangsuensis]
MFEEMIARIAGRFTRVEPRRRARTLLLGLLSDLPDKNCWTISEYAGDETPDGLQHFLRKAVWDADEVRDDLRDYVTEHLGDTGAVLVVDETGDLKKGVHTVGVQRQYTGTAGRIENAQVAVYLTYATDTGHAFIDRALYLPKSWTTDPDRCADTGIPATTVFATKPALARTMIGRALDAGVRARWVAGDEVYGADPGLRADLEKRGVGYVLAIGCDRRVSTPAGVLRADGVAARLPKHVWQRLSAGAGAKGHRYYDWAFADIDLGEADGHRWLLIRRNRTTGELAFYRCYSPEPMPLRILVQVAGRRWTVEESFQTAKGLTGLDQHQARHWTSWHRWTVMAMLAHAFLAVVASTQRNPEPTTVGWISLTCNEIHHLFTTLISRPVHDVAHRLRCSNWRRRHQYRARQTHYQRQSTREP